MATYSNATYEFLESYVHDAINNDSNVDMNNLINNVMDLGFNIDLECITDLYNKYKKTIQKKDENNNNIKKLWLDAQREYMPLLISRLSIKINVVINGKNYDALIDTGAEVNIMSKKIVDDCGLHDKIDQSYKCQIVGVAGMSKTSCGFIPYLNISLGGQFETPCPFMVMEEEHVDIILCQAFLSYYKAVLDFNNNTLIMDGQKIGMRICDK